MKKPYQIESQRAVKRLEGMAAEGNPAVQMILPMAEMVGWLRQGVGELVRQAGLQLMSLLMEEEVRQLAGERSQRQRERSANRWGKEQGYCVVMGQKVPIERLRVRSTDDQLAPTDGGCIQRREVGASIGAAVSIQDNQRHPAARAGNNHTQPRRQ